MNIDIRTAAAKYYDYNPETPVDIPFYRSLIPSADASVLKLVMRCYYPATFEHLILDHGFNILNKWGGYAGEIYGEGTELVIQFNAKERN